MRGMRVLHFVSETSKYTKLTNFEPFFIPPLHAGFLSRPRLVEQLNAGVSCKLTLITDPPDLYQTVFPWYDPPTEVEAEEKSGE